MSSLPLVPPGKSNFTYRKGLKRWEGFPYSWVGKESVCSAGDPGSIPRLGRSTGEGNGNLFQYSCLEKPMDRGAWQATAHGVARVRHNLTTKPPPPKRWDKLENKILNVFITYFDILRHENNYLRGFFFTFKKEEIRKRKRDFKENNILPFLFLGENTPMIGIHQNCVYSISCFYSYLCILFWLYIEWVKTV